MRGLAKKYKGLEFLIVLAFVLVVFAIAVAQNDSDNSKHTEALAVQPDGQITQGTVSEQKDVSVTQPVDQNTQEPNVGSEQKDVPAAEPNDQASQDSNDGSVQKDVPATQTKSNDDPAQKDDPAAKPVDQNTQEPNVGSKQKDTSTPLQQRLRRTISIDCINTPIEDVIRMLAEQANVDIIKSPTVTGSVTAKLTNVPLEEALNNILAVHGYGCVIDKSMIRIAPADEIAQKGEVLDTKVYRITYADVAQVEKALTKFISKRGSISSSIGTSDIIVTDTTSSMRAIDDFITEIDRITPQVMVEVRIYDVTSTDGFDIGTEWTAARNNPITTISSSDISGTGTTTTKTTETAWQSSGAGEAIPSYTYKKSKPFVGGSFDADSGGSIRFGLLDSVNVEFTLSMLKSDVGAKLLANPRILVLDNETADFKIISEIPYTEQSQTSSGGSMTSTQFKDVGVELSVTPHVTRDGMVRLHVVPEFGVVSEKGKTLSTGQQTVPTVDTRKIDTKALLKDGQTVVLGGLRRRTVTQTVKKVPFIGDVPLMGTLFSTVSEEVKTNELIIFITPRILAEQALLAPREADDLKATHFSNPRTVNAGEERPGEPGED
jgi:type IV pilus assembly protein PilQ